jgi:gliding motility-associated-like protein
MFHASNAQEFVFASLSGSPINTQGWNFQGAAKIGNSPGSPANGEIILTEPINTQSGAIFFNTPINLSQCKKWVAEFDFRIFDGSLADGLAFCYLDVPPSGFVTGGGVGIPQTANGLKVVLDTWLNCGTDRVPKIQIRWGAGYDECNGQPTRNNNDGRLNFIRSATYNKCRIEYEEGNIKVFLNGEEYLTAFQTFNFTGYFGFTASTGGSNDRHSIKNVRIFTEMPPSEANAGPEVGFCPNGTAVLGANPTPGYSYKWTPTTGLSNPNVSNPIVSLPNNGTNHLSQKYFVETSFTDRPGCASRDSVIVNVWANPQPQFDFDTGCLPGSNILFLNTTKYDPQPIINLAWEWNFGNPLAGSTNTSTALNPAHFYTQTGPFTVDLSATSDKGCKGSISREIYPLAPKPVSDFSISHSSCLAEDARFTSESTAASPDSITQWKWILPTGVIAAGKTYTSRFLTPGIFEVKHVAVSSRGCESDTIKKSITINPNPIAAFNLSGPFCKGQNVVIKNTSSTQNGTLTRWYWMMGNGQVFDRNSSSDFVYNFPETGVYTIKLVVTNSSGCQSDTARQTITVGHVPFPDFELPDVCLNDAFAEFNNTSTIEDGTINAATWLWNFGDPNANAGNPNTSTALNGRHRYTEAAIYPIKLLVTSSLGCRDSITQNITINGDKPLASFNILTPDTSCSNLPVRIQNTSTVNFGKITRVVIFWDDRVNISDTTTDENPIPDKIYVKNYPPFNFPASKQVTIRFVAYSGGVCINEIEKVLTLYSVPTANWQVSPSAGCFGSPIQFTDQSSSAVNNISRWKWIFGDGNSSDVQNPAHIFRVPGNFRVKMVATTIAGCLSDTAENQVVIHPNPSVNAGPDQVILQGGQITLQATVSGSNNYTFNWTPDTWLNDPNILQPITRAESDITYTLTVTGIGGCTASDNVFVKQLLRPVIPNAFSPNGDGINDIWTIRYLDSYPGATVQIFDRYGRRIYISTGYNTPWDGKYNGSPLPAGVYYYIVDPKNGLKSINGSVTLIR